MSQLYGPSTMLNVPAEQLLATLEKVRNIGHWHVDLTQKRISWSERAAELHFEEPDFSPQNFKQAMAYYHVSDRAKLRIAIEAAIKTGRPFSCVVRMRKSKLKVRYVRINGEAGAVDGKTTEIWGFIEDVTREEHTRLEKNRAKAIERKLRSAIDEMNVGFILFDERDRMIWCNEIYGAFYPKSKPALEAGAHFKRILEYGLAQGEFADAVGQEQAWLTQRLAHHDNHSDTPIEVRLRDGRWVLAHDVPMRDGGWAGFRVDITELKSLQKKLSSALFEARTAGHLQASLLPNLVHELKTPLNAVIGFAQLLRVAGNGADNAAKIIEYAEDIEHSGLHMVSVIENILMPADVDADGATTSVSLNDVLDRASHVAADLALKKGKSLKFNRPEDTILVKAHQTKLVQVLINLLSNAAKYSPNGGMIEIKVDAPDARSLRIWVIDDGDGIASGQKDRIFDRYDRLSADRQGDDGIGIGLAIVKELIEEMGGRIGVENVPGRGAGFWIALERYDDNVSSNKEWYSKGRKSRVGLRAAG